MSGQELISRQKNAKVYGKLIVFIIHETCVFHIYHLTIKESMFIIFIL